MKKLPPIEKVYEAWSAIADGRVHMIDANRAEVTSSDDARTYTIIYNAEIDTYYSDDNATYWRGYPGYPVIAMMMEQGKLPIDRVEIGQWKDINWHELNERHRRNYAAAVAEVENVRHIDASKASVAAELVMTAIKASEADVKRLTPKILKDDN